MDEADDDDVILQTTEDKIEYSDTSDKEDNSFRDHIH